MIFFVAEVLESKTASPFMRFFCISAASTGIVKPTCPARSCKVSECALDASSLNAGDVFILETQDVIYQWNGKEANKKEKAKGLEVSTDIRAEERGGKCKLEVVEMGAEPAAFWEAIGGEKPIAGAVSDTTAAASGGGNAKLFKVSDSTGSMQTTEVAS